MVDEAGLPTRGPAAVRQRRQAVIALTVFCWLFFIGAIAASYVIALAHGYGTGFGDGRLLPAGTGADKGPWAPYPAHITNGMCDNNASSATPYPCH